MKLLGYIFIAIGLGLLVFIGFITLGSDKKAVSPIPDTDSIKVIQLSPTR